MIASAAHQALSLALASLEDPALDEVRLDRVTPEGKSVHARFVCPAAQHPRAIAALSRAAHRLGNELAAELDRKRALRLTWTLLTEEEEQAHTAHLATEDA